MTLFRVCIVDDDPLARVIAADALDDCRYLLSECESGEACLDHFAGPAPHPDVLLLDIGLPGIDGYAVCCRLREAGHHDTQVIFVSARDDLASRLAAFDAGGSDFIMKPFAPGELRHHVTLAENHQGQRRALAEEIAFVRQTAFSAMSTMGEMGTILQFTRDSFACFTPQALAEKTFAALAGYGLEGLIQLRCETGSLALAPGGSCTELEISILNYAGNLARIVQMGDRLVINYPRATLLALNLPLDDPDRVGRLRDHLALLAEGMDARLAALDLEAARLAQSRGIVDALAELTQTLAEIEAQQSRNRQAVLALTTDYHEKLQNAFIGMGLSERQESLLGELAEDTLHGLESLLASGEALGDRLRQVSHGLTGLLPA